MEIAKFVMRWQLDRCEPGWCGTQNLARASSLVPSGESHHRIRLKAGIRLMFWSGMGFDEEKLKPGTGKFKDASALYATVAEIDADDVKRWLGKAAQIQWDYKNVVKRKGKLERLK